jgi:hypothetical protein
MIEVFSTNVQSKVHADEVLTALKNSFPDLKINFDLGDLDLSLPFCHSILRVEGASIDAEKIIEIVTRSGSVCDVLEDKICE